MAPLTQVKKDGITWPVTQAIVNTDVNNSAAIAGSKIASLVSNDADNRLLTATGTTNSFNGEANLTFDGTSLNLPTVNTWIKGGGHNVLQVDATMSYLYGGSGGAQFRNADNSSALVQILNDGKIGIGTTSPQVTGIHINGANARLQLTDSTTGAASGDGVIFGLNGDQDFFINNREDDKHLLFFTESTERLKIDSNGSVHIDGATSANHGLRFTPNGWNGYDNRMGFCGASGADFWWSSNWNPTDGARDHSGFATNFIRQNVDTGYIAFGTGPADTTASERLRILSGGGITFNGDTAAANALSDYEEGTFTPSIAAVSAGWDSRTGTYIKVGNIVTVYIHLNTASGGSTNGDQVAITGLPFTSANNNGRAGATVAYHDGLITSDYDFPFLIVSSNGTAINFHKGNGNSFTGNDCNTSDFALIVSAVYPAN